MLGAFTMVQSSPNGTSYGGKPFKTDGPPLSSWAIWIISLVALVDPGLQKLRRRGVSPTVSALFLIAIIYGGLSVLLVPLYLS